MYTPVKLRPSEMRRLGCGGGFLFLLSIGALYFALYTLLTLLTAALVSQALPIGLDRQPVSAIASVSVFVGIVIAILGTGRIYRAFTPLARAEAVLSTTSLRPGESGSANVSLFFRRDARVRKTRLELVLRESATYTQGTSTTTDRYEHIVASQDFGEALVSAKQPLAVQWQFAVPPQAMHTFTGRSNGIRWILRARVEGLGSRPSVVGFPLTVVAERLASPAPAPAKGYRSTFRRSDKGLDLTVMLRHTHERAAQAPLRFAPGERLEGTVTLSAQRPITCRMATARLEWWTQGRGTREHQTVASVVLQQGSLTVSQLVEYPIQLTVPLAPWSFADHYVNIVWYLIVEVDVGGLRWRPGALLTVPIVLA